MKKGGAKNFSKSPFLVEKLEKISPDDEQKMLEQRRRSLIATLQALISPTFPLEYYENILSQLDSLLPGKNSGKNLTGSFNDFREQFIVPPEKVDTVFKAAIAEDRNSKNFSPLQLSRRIYKNS